MGFRLSLWRVEEARESFEMRGMRFAGRDMSKGRHRKCRRIMRIEIVKVQGLEG